MAECFTSQSWFNSQYSKNKTSKHIKKNKKTKNPEFKKPSLTPSFLLCVTQSLSTTDAHALEAAVGGSKEGGLTMIKSVKQKDKEGKAPRKQ